MFTYGYIREAVLAQIDLDEDEANAMNILSRLHIFANEAMQAICGVKPKYEYVNITVGEEFANLVDSSFSVKVGDIVKLSDVEGFIAIADKQEYKLNVKRAGLCNTIIERKPCEYEDFSYVSNNGVCFNKCGIYQIPIKKVWYIFKSGISDIEELDMPNDILITIPLYIAALCLQMDNVEKAQLKRQEFEIALARCTNTDFMPTRRMARSW